MFLVFDAGQDYDYNVFDALYVVDTEEEAEELVDLLNIERRKLTKLDKEWYDKERALYAEPDRQARREMIIKHNNRVKEICKVTPIEWHNELHGTGDYPLNMIDSFVTRYHKYDFQEIPLYKKV